MESKLKQVSKLIQEQKKEVEGIADAFESYIVALENILEELRDESINAK